MDELVERLLITVQVVLLLVLLVLPVPVDQPVDSANSALLKLSGGLRVRRFTLTAASCPQRRVFATPAARTF